MPDLDIATTVSVGLIYVAAINLIAGLLGGLVDWIEKRKEKNRD